MLAPELASRYKYIYIYIYLKQSVQKFPTDFINCALHLFCPPPPLITTAAFNFVLQRLRLADAREEMRAQRVSERPPVNRRSDGSRAPRGASGFTAAVSGGGGRGAAPGNDVSSV